MRCNFRDLPKIRWNLWFAWFGSLFVQDWVLWWRMCSHSGTIWFLLVKPRLFIFLDIYEMPSFVDNYEMLSFVDICEMLSFFRYILDVEFIWNMRCWFTWTHMTYKIYMRIYNHFHCVRRRCWDSCRWIHMRCLDEHIWDV